MTILVTGLLLVGCGTSSGTSFAESRNFNDADEESFIEQLKELMDEHDIRFYEEEWADIDWKGYFEVTNISRERVQTHANISLITPDEIINTGNAMIEYLQGIGRYKDYILLEISLSRNDNVWLFDYSLDPHGFGIDVYIISGALTIAIDGNTYDIIGMWHE